MRESSSLEEFQTGLIRFLASPIIGNGAGSIYSWVNPDHPGFVYPESMGLHLRLTSYLAAARRDERIGARAREVTEGLQRLIPPSGGVGLKGHLYLFDTCMAAAGLVAYKRLLGGAVDPAVLSAMAGFISSLAERRLALVDHEGGVPRTEHHWSTIFGAHMLKTVIAIDSLAEETGRPALRSLATEIAEEVTRGCLTDGVFRIGAEDGVVYCHAHCYALEGLLYLRARGYADTTPTLRAGAERLREWQNEDGSLYNWYQDPSRARAKVGDATAQAIRIWVAVDREAFKDSIDRGFAFLAGLRSPDSGLYYCAGSRDVNSVTSIFATQAAEWFLRGPRPEWLV